MVHSIDEIVELERQLADDEVRFAMALAELDPGWGTRVASVGDGVGVLCGPGLFVNTAFGVGLTGHVEPSVLDHFEQLCARVGVPPAFECTDATTDDLTAELRGRGYAPESETSVLVHDLAELDQPSAGVEITQVTHETLTVWQDASAQGWGHVAEEALRANDLFAAVGMQTDDPGLMLATDAAERHVVGCATLKILGPRAVLGGMSTLPAARRRGVQSDLIWHRLQLARAAGCTVAISSAQRDSDSERNLVRHGFQIAYRRTSFARP